MGPESTMTRNRAARDARDGSRPRAESTRSNGPGGSGPAAPGGSVTGDVANLRASDPRVRDEAARRIWERFAPRLCALARSRLNSRIRVREDENDIVQSLFRSFFAAQQGPGHA